LNKVPGVHTPVTLVLHMVWCDAKTCIFMHNQDRSVQIRGRAHTCEFIYSVLRTLFLYLKFNVENECVVDLLLNLYIELEFLGN
jgi:hypothetical protein